MKNYKVLASTSVEELAESLGLGRDIFKGIASFQKIVSILGLRSHFYTHTQTVNFTAKEFFENLDFQSRVLLLCNMPPREANNGKSYVCVMCWDYYDIGDGDELQGAVFEVEESSVIF